MDDCRHRRRLIGEIPEEYWYLLLYRPGGVTSRQRRYPPPRKSIFRSAGMYAPGPCQNLLENGQSQEVRRLMWRSAQTITGPSSGEDSPGRPLYLSGNSQRYSRLDRRVLAPRISNARPAGNGRLASTSAHAGAAVREDFGSPTASKNFGKWWSTPPKKSPPVRSLLPGSPGFIRRWSVWRLWRWRSCRRWRADDWSRSVYSALCFLAISCPCALVISVPLSFFAGIGRASREGILVKGGNYLETLANAEIVAFDKTAR